MIDWDKSVYRSKGRRMRTEGRFIVERFEILENLVRGERAPHVMRQGRHTRGQKGRAASQMCEDDLDVVKAAFLARDDQMSGRLVRLVRDLYGAKLGFGILGCIRSIDRGTCLADGKP